MTRALAYAVILLCLLQGAASASVYGNACCHPLMSVTTGIDRDAVHNLEDGAACPYHEKELTAQLAPAEPYCTLETFDVQCGLCGHVHHVRLCGKYQDIATE